MHAQRNEDDLYLVGHVWRDGRLSMVASNGWVRPVVCGGDGEDNPPPPAGAGTPPAPGAPGGAGGQGTQPAPDLNGLQRVIDDAKRTGTTEATASVLTALGFESIEAAQSWVTAKRDEENAALSEVERRERAAAEREQQAQDRESAATERERTALIRAALVEANAPRDGAADLVALVHVEGDVTDESVAAAVEKVKAKFPQLFATSGTAPSTTSGAHPPAQQTTTSGLEAGRERARQTAERRKPIVKQANRAAS